MRAEEAATSNSQQNFVVTNVLLGLNIGIFLLMLLNHVPLMSATSNQVLRWGANFGPLTLGAQPWRVLSNIFVHIGLIHLIGNMWALFVLGRLAESLYGRTGFLLIYLCTGVVGTMTTAWWNPLVVSAGASGALMGIVGALVATLYAGRLPLPKKAVRPVLVTLVFWGALTLVYGFATSGSGNARIDNAAHVGGLIAGLILGYSVGHHLGSEAVERHLRWRVYAVMLLMIAGFGFFVRARSGYVVVLDKSRQLLLARKPDEALKILKAAVQRDPTEPTLHLRMAEAYVLKSDFANAESEYKRSIALFPNAPESWAGLAEIYGKQQKWAEAAANYRKAAEAARKNVPEQDAYLWYNAGTMYSRADRQAEAVQAFQKAVGSNPYLAEAWYAMGISQLNQKQVPQAVQSLQMAVQLRPNHAEMHLWLGNALLAAGQEQRAQAEFLKAFQIRAAQQKIVQQQLLRRQQMQQKAQQNVTPK